MLRSVARSVGRWWADGIEGARQEGVGAQDRAREVVGWTKQVVEKVFEVDPAADADADNVHLGMSEIGPGVAELEYSCVRVVEW